MGTQIDRTWAHGFARQGDISADEFETVKTAWLRTVAVLEVEEKFNVLVENYVDYERELLDVTLRNMVSRDMEWSRTTDDIYSVNRRLLNLLMSFKLYADQVDRDVKKLCGREALQTLIDARKAQEEASLSFRLLDVLRNYSQHAGMPVVGVTLDTESRTGAYGVRVDVGLSDFRMDRKVIASRVLDDLAPEGDTFDVTPHVRESVACFGQIHETTRKLVHADHDARFKMLSDVLGDFDGPKRETVVLYKGTERFGVFDELMHRVHYLQKKNRYLVFAADRYVSGHSPKPRRQGPEMPAR